MVNHDLFLAKPSHAVTKRFKNYYKGCEKSGGCVLKFDAAGVSSVEQRGREDQLN